MARCATRLLLGEKHWLAARVRGEQRREKSPGGTHENRSHRAAQWVTANVT